MNMNNNGTGVRVFLMNLWMRFYYRKSSIVVFHDALLSQQRYFKLKKIVDIHEFGKLVCINAAPMLSLATL